MGRTSNRRFRIAFAAATLVVLALLAVRRADPLPQGLRATYYASDNWTNPVQSRLDPVPSAERMYLAWNLRPPEVYSVIWQGALATLRAGRYTFALTSDDGAWLYVDDRPCLELPGVHPSTRGTCTVDLERGVHGMQLRYVQAGGEFELALDWARAGDALVPIGQRWLLPSRVPFGRFLLDLASAWALGCAEGIWAVLALGWIGMRARPHAGRLLTAVRSDRALRALSGVIAASFALNAVGIWCGMSNNQGWLGDEILPSLVLDAIRHRFSNGWWGWYPPVHYYLLTLFYSPVLLLEWLGQVDPTRGFWYDVLHAINRGVVLLEGGGLLVAVYLCAAEAFSKRAGVYAAAALSLLVLFVAYTKVGNIEVPYVFWFGVSMVFYLRSVRQPTVWNFAWFAVAGGLSIASKDQAYGLFLCTPLVLWHAVWRDRRRAGDPQAALRALVDRRMLAAAAGVGVTFVLGNNLIFNYEGMISRQNWLASGARMVHGFEMFDAMPGQRLELLVSATKLAGQSWGWPLMVAGMAGWAAALRSGPSRRAAVALTVVAASYYLFFINLVMYCYDRFLLPICVVQAMFAGYFFDRWLSGTSPGPVFRRAVVAVVFGYSLLYAGMYDALLLRDSRYAVERWLRERAEPGTTIGVNFVPRLQPNLDGFRVREFERVQDVERFRPQYYVYDADYARAVAPDSPMGRLLAGLRDGTIGYERVLEYRSPVPWGWLPGAHPELAGPRTGTSVTSSLGDVNPTFLVFRRND